jgi:SAM-dependent methyltransferase
MQKGRNEILDLLASAAATRAASKASPRQTAAAAESKDQFVARVMEDCGAALRCALCNIGDRLGLFKTMAGSGPLTVAALAHKTGLNARMLREWLNAMATASYVEFRRADQTYVLSPDHASFLADEESSPLFLGGLFQLLIPLVSAAPKVARAFQTGKPVTMYDFRADLCEGSERISAPGFKHELVQKWIPSLPRVQQALMTGGAAVDVGCGTGRASIVMAKAFPNSKFAGYDPHEPSIQRARMRAKKEGVSGRVRFVVGDASNLPPHRFDLVTLFGSAHHFSDPIRSLRHCRRALKPGGTCFVLDADLSLNPDENMNTAGRIAYAATTLWCLQDSMANNGVGLGSEFNEAVLRALAAKSGFSQCRKLAQSTPLKAYYELRG